MAAPEQTSVTRRQRLLLPRTATVGTAEESLDRFFHDVSDDGARDLELDLSQCEFIEPATLIYLIGFLAKRQRASCATSIRLPTEKKVRDFLRIWEFQQAVRSATGQPFVRLVSPDDKHYFGENPDPVDDVHYRGRVVTVAGERVRLLSKAFFGIRTFFAAQSGSPYLIAKQESNGWREQHIVSVLDRHLHGHGERVSSHIIYEAMMNAFRHPAASLIQTTSHFSEPASSKGASGAHLTIVIWDDGESMVDTLRAAISAGQPIKSDASLQRFYADYRYVYESPTGAKSKPEQIRSDLIPGPGTPDSLLLLATTFPGITRDVSGIGHSIDSEGTFDDELHKMPGMGLYVLSHAVVDTFKGSVSIRTKNHFLNVKPSAGTDDAGPVQYSAKVREYGSWLPAFLGNMITIRLPLKSSPRP